MDTTFPAAAGTAGYGYADLPALISLMTGDSKHDGAAASTLDVLWVLYDRVLRVSPATIGDDGRDRFLLSKGHGPMAYYAVLAAKGFIDPAELPGYGGYGPFTCPAIPTRRNARSGRRPPLTGWSISGCPAGPRWCLLSG